MGLSVGLLETKERTVVGKGENVILNPKHHVTYVNMTGFWHKSVSHSNFSFSLRALGDIYILV